MTKERDKRDIENKFMPFYFGDNVSTKKRCKH